jgi:hypothetical protein
MWSGRSTARHLRGASNRDNTASNVDVGTGFAAWLPLASGIMISTFDGRHQTKLFDFSRLLRVTVVDDLLLFGTPAAVPMPPCTSSG